MKKIIRIFSIPLFVLGTIVLYFSFANLIQSEAILNVFLWVGIFVGSINLVKETVANIIRKTFALDYIAILAIGTGLYTGDYVVSAVIVLMMASGNSLEVYASEKATDSLKQLENRIPNEVLVEETNGDRVPTPINEIELDSSIVVRKGEVIPLDGVLYTEFGEFDESSLTGEALPVRKSKGDLVRSGTLNIGELIIVKTTVIDRDSTFRKIVSLVSEAQSKKAPFIQLADQISAWFTFVALIIGIYGYFNLGGIAGFLAVLVVATPCPLLLAVPIALMGGVNAAAKKRVVFRRLAALEILSRVDAVVFDKTGTLTFGSPVVSELKILNSNFTEKQILQFAAALERNSFHPYAKAIMSFAHGKLYSPITLSKLSELPGAGIIGDYDGKTYQILRGRDANESTSLLFENNKEIAEFVFKDIVKETSFDVITKLTGSGVKVSVYTGDSAARTNEMLKPILDKVEVVSECTPADKLNGVKKLKSQGHTTAMIGDGINDAPALALSDVGLVFSHQEQTAATEAADVVLLNGNLETVLTTYNISKSTMKIAKQSMYIGVVVSILLMIAASLGHIPPLYGAISQEILDVAVIINALRAANSKA